MTFRTGKQVIVLDVADMVGIDAGGVGLLASIFRWALHNGIQLKLMEPPALVRKVLQLAGLDIAFEIFTCEDLAALFGFGRRTGAVDIEAGHVAGPSLARGADLPVG